MAHEPSTYIRLAVIVEAVAAFSGVDVFRLVRGGAGTRDARHAVQYLAERVPGVRHADIAAMLNIGDRSTVSKNISAAAGRLCVSADRGGPFAGLIFAAAGLADASNGDHALRETLEALGAAYPEARAAAASPSHRLTDSPSHSSGGA